jgi:hypothetical protein
MTVYFWVLIVLGVNCEGAGSAVILFVNRKVFGAVDAEYGWNHCMF